MAGIALITVLLTLIVPPFVSELSELGTNVEMGSRKAGLLLLTLVLTFFFVKDGRRMWSWIAGLVGAFIAVPLAAVAGAVIDFARSR